LTWGTGSEPGDSRAADVIEEYLLK
jgi:hypothetical protein